jgi:hypothetical protein
VSQLQAAAAAAAAAQVHGVSNGGAPMKKHNTEAVSKLRFVTCDRDGMQ